jgi:NADPH2:quinone reductase
MKSRAIVVREKGGPDALRAEEIDLPPPAPGEAQVRHEAIGLNYIDVYFRRGWYPPPAYPFVPGLEAAGVVTAIGAGVRDVAVGDRVGYASHPLGAYADARNMPADRLVALPSGIDARTAAAAMLKGMTAQYLLRRTFRVERGHRVLVHAAAGGVGTLLCQWAKHLGATVLGTVSTDAKAARASEHGCDHPILYTREDFVARVAAITGGAGVHVVYDSVGKDTFLRSLECLAPMGMLALYGQSSGAVDPLDVSILARKSLFLTRPGLPTYTAQRADLLASARELFEMIEADLLDVRAQHERPLAEVVEAHRDLEERRTSGATILVP